MISRPYYILFYTSGVYFSKFNSMIEYFKSPVPDNSPLWIFQSDRELTAPEKDILSQRLDAFLSSWKSHEAIVTGQAVIFENRFVLMAGHSAEISGCSKDSLFQIMKSASQELGCSLLTPQLISYRENGAIKSLERALFSSYVKKGLIGPRTVVFDVTLTHVRELNEGKFETQAQNTWMKRFFEITKSANIG